MHLGYMRAGVSLFITIFAQAAADAGVHYAEINGFLCISNNFTRAFTNIRMDLQCAAECSNEPLCQAFTTTDGPCQLFVFDKCSKNVKICGCSRTGKVFTKQKDGVPLGALCPPGYGDDLCGTKYKMYTGYSYWSLAKQKCESESGLVIMSDVIDATEMNQVELVGNRSRINFFLGGYQAPGSVEPAGGWYWVACNITLLQLWCPGEPNNAGNIQFTIAKWFEYSNLCDCEEYNLNITGVMCECVSPFD